MRRLAEIDTSWPKPLASSRHFHGHCRDGVYDRTQTADLIAMTPGHVVGA
jgi:hypothetical protein